MSLTKQEKELTKRYVANGAEIMFIPSTALVEQVARGELPTGQLNDSIELALLTKEPIRMHPDMIVRYCDDQLNKRNTWVLDRGDIKIVPKRLETKMEDK